MTVTLDQALHSRSDAIIFLRSGNVSPEDKAAVCSQWGAQWVINILNTSADDENNYIINDDIYNNAYNAGQDKAADVSKDAKKEKPKDIVKASVTGAAAATGAVFSGIAAKATAKAGVKIGIRTSTKAVEKAGEQMAKAGTATSAKAGTKAVETAGKTSAIIGASIAIATAILYWVLRPNKKAKEGIDELQNTMTESQGALNAEQANMEQATNEIAEKSAEAEDVQEDAQSDIDDKKTAYDRFYESFMELKAKVDAGEPLTEDEKALFGALVQYLKECGVNIEDLVKASSDEVKDILNEIGLSEESFNQAMETIGEVQGATDYAASTDETTRILCYVEAASQGINAISGAISGARLMGMGPWLWALGAASIAAAGSSAYAVAEQLKWASEITNEINMRLETEDVNTETNDLWEQSVAAYDEYFSYVEGLNVVEPDDVDPNVVDGINPDDVPTVDPNDPGAAGGTSGTTPEPKNKDEDDKKKFLFVDPGSGNVT